MNEAKRGYWIYSIVAVVFGMSMIAFIAWLVYDIILKLADKDFSSNTVVQAFITLLVTVFIGGYFSKWLEVRNHKSVELYKTRTVISLRLVDLLSEYVHHPKDKSIKEMLITESKKVKLFFPDNVLRELNAFIDNKEVSNEQYAKIVDELRKYLK